MGVSPQTPHMPHHEMEVQMKRVLLWSMMICLLFGSVNALYAGTEEDVKTLALKGASMIKKNGKDKGIAEIMSPNGPLSAQFKSGKLNLTVNNLNGVNLANHSFPALIGQNHYTLQDANGKPFMKDAIDIAKAKGGGWIEFAFTNPDTRKIGRWKGWVQRIEGMDLFVMGLTWKQ